MQLSRLEPLAKKAQNGLRPLFLGVSRAKKHPTPPAALWAQRAQRAAGPYGRIAPEGGVKVRTPAGPGGESKREGGE